MGFAIVILILAFGSVLAMGLPIVTAVAGIVAGVITVGVVSNLIPMPDFTSIIAVMIGLGVGIDYALFIVTRYREDLHKGMPGERAAGHALDTAGRAVIFAGLTVVISLLGMMAMGLGFIRGIGIGSAIPVLFVLVASITLLPAFLGLAGCKLEVTRTARAHRRRPRGPVARGPRPRVRSRLPRDRPWPSRRARRRAVPAGAEKQLPPVARSRPGRPSGTATAVGCSTTRGVRLGGLVILLVLALPVLASASASPTRATNEDTTNRQAYDLLAEGSSRASTARCSWSPRCPTDRRAGLGVTGRSRH